MTISLKQNSYRDRFDIEDYRFLSDIVDDKLSAGYYDDNREFIAFNPIIDIDLDVYNKVNLNSLFWSEYSWRRINDNVPARWFMRLKAKTRNIESTYQKLYATLNMIENPFVNRFIENSTQQDGNIKEKLLVVENRKTDSSNSADTSEKAQVNALQVNQNRIDTGSENKASSESTDNSENHTFGFNKQENYTEHYNSTTHNDTTNNTSSDGNSQETQSLTADNSRNMATQDGINFHFDVPQNKQQTILPEFTENFRGTPYEGSETAENNGYVTTQDRQDGINNGLAENRNTNTTGARGDAYHLDTHVSGTQDFNQTLDKVHNENTEKSDSNSYSNSVLDSKQVATTQEVGVSNLENSTESGSKSVSNVIGNTKEYLDKDSRRARQNNVSTFYISKGLTGVTLSKALEQYRKTIINFENRFLNEYRDLFLGIL